MKKFTELKENTPTVHAYRGYHIKEYEGKFHVQKTPGTTLSHHASKKDAKSRIDYYHRLPQKSMAHGDMVSLVNETKWHVDEAKEKLSTHEKQAKLMGLVNHGNGNFGSADKVTHVAPKSGDVWSGLSRLVTPRSLKEEKEGPKSTLPSDEPKKNEESI
jgi:hypothetical protein